MPYTPLSQDEVARLARAMLALEVPEECRPGVAANLVTLAEHARRVAGEVPM